MAMIAMSAVIYMVMWTWFRQQNRKRDAGKEDHKVEGMAQEDIEEMGEHNPQYRYTY